LTDIVTEPDLGRHNADPAAASRIIEGGTWKKQRTVMLLPCAPTVPSKCALSWMNMITPPNQAFTRWLLMGDEVGVAYSNAIEQILANPVLSEWEYVLTVESDNTIPPDGFLKLIKRMEEHPELACIGGLYWTKGEAGVPQIWGDTTDPVVNYRPQAPVLGELVECYGTGMGFNLWRMSMFKDEKLRKPWFKTVSSMEEGCGTQDLYFWGDARKYGYRCAVDCGVLVGHLDVASGVTW
jgi:hypothetical protein